MNSVLLNGDALARLRELLSESVTAIVTDPPYALEFMGKGWDKVLPSVDIWRECLRVLKPGGVLLAFGGTRTFHRLTCAIEDAGFEIHDCLSWLYGSGFPKSLDIGKAVNGWSGYGTALKPAWEPIIFARKPTDGTFAANALTYGVAGINVNGCRIGNEERPLMVCTDTVVAATAMSGRSTGATSSGELTTQGRWPANVVHDGSAEVLSCFPDAPGQIARGKAGDGRETANVYGAYKHGGGDSHIPREDDTKSAARFFYCAKASKSDRGEGNTHPTVKPVELMRWLVRMVKMPTGTLVLDPFAGSGSTGVACAAEGVDFLGIEQETAYIEIARQRLLAAGVNPAVW